MAPRRILSSFLLLFIITIASSCSSTAEMLPIGDAAARIDTSDVGGNNDYPNSTLSETGDPEINRNLSFYERYQSKLSDRYTFRENEIPFAFQFEVETEEPVEKNPFEGFRVQIYTGSDVQEADTVAMEFRAWSDTTLTGYQADTYIFFKPPTYRVHVGDFHSQVRANTYARLLKRKYRSAWVVFDRVNPWNVPADSVTFDIQRR